MSPINRIRVDVHIHTHPLTVMWLVFIVSLAAGVFLGGR